ncbi:hypothetical protein C2I36_15385 [Rhodobacteraceae bacterium WD3A24]|nr:hypothetical protein C2I36_15385 [Rhodobacteraceae bacterium WD3A24]
MTGFDLKDHDNIEGIAIDAFATSRDCATGLRVDVLPNLPPSERPRAQALLADIEARRIFERKTLNLLEGVIDTISRRVLDGTEEIEGFHADDCHADGGAMVTQRLRTETADDLARALPLLLALRDSIHAVHDAMHAIHAVDKLRAAHNRSAS